MEGAGKVGIRRYRRGNWQELSLIVRRLHALDDSRGLKQNMTVLALKREYTCSKPRPHQTISFPALMTSSVQSKH